MVKAGIFLLMRFLGQCFRGTAGMVLDYRCAGPVRWLSVPSLPFIQHRPSRLLPIQDADSSHLGLITVLLGYGTNRWALVAAVVPLRSTTRFFKASAVHGRGDHRPRENGSGHSDVCWRVLAP